MSEIISASLRAMKKGVIVITTVTLESLEETTHTLRKRGITPEVTEVNISRSEPVGKKTLMRALNPVFIIRGIK